MSGESFLSLSSCSMVPHSYFCATLLGHEGEFLSTFPYLFSLLDSLLGWPCKWLNSSRKFSCVGVDSSLLFLDKTTLFFPYSFYFFQDVNNQSHRLQQWGRHLKFNFLLPLDILYFPYHCHLSLFSVVVLALVYLPLLCFHPCIFLFVSSL